MAFTLADAIAGRSRPLYWTKIVHRDEAGDPAVFPWAPITIADPADYYDGLKAEKILSVGDISCPLSDRSGSLQVPTCDVTYSDLPGSDGLMVLRGMLGRDLQRALRGAEYTIYAVTDADRRTAVAPVILFRGYIDRYSGPPEYQFTINARGWIAKRLKAALWKELVRDLFPSAPVDNRDIPLPIALGVLSDKGSSTPAPVFVDDEAGRGGGSMFGGWVNSYGDIATPPTATLNLAEDASAGSIPAGTYYGMYTRVVSSVESDPYPFLPQDAVPITVSADAAIEMDAPDDGADSYRFYLGVALTGPGEIVFDQYIETTDPTTPVAFTQITEGVNPASPGAIVGNNPFAYAAVLAVMGDGRTVLSEVAFLRSAGYFRPVRLAWTPIVGAVSYELYTRNAPSPDAPYERRFAVPASQLNGNGDVYWEWLWNDGSAYAFVDGAPLPQGVIAPVFVGGGDGTFSDLTGFSTWYGFLVSARPCAGDWSIYLDGIAIDPTDGRFAVPGVGAWTTLFGSNLYTAVGSYRPTLLFMRPGADADAVIAGEKTLRVNVSGLEDVGDGTGDVIESIFEQFRVIAQNCLLADESDITGTFDAVPEFSDTTPRLDLASLTQAEADALTTTGEPDAMRWLPGSLTGDAFLQDWCPSAAAKVGIKPNGQTIVCVHNTAAAPVAQLEEQFEILRPSFSFEATDQGFANSLDYGYEAKYDSPTSAELQANGTEQHAQSIIDNRELVPDAAQSYLWRRSAILSLQVAVYSLALSAYLPQIVQAASVLHWTARSPGEVVGVTHRQGPAESGIVARKHAILGMNIALASFTVGLTMLDLEANPTPLVEPSGSIPAGSLAFSGWGDSPMKFLSIDGIDLGTVAANPQIGDGGLNGIRALDDGTVCINGADNPGPNFECSYAMDKNFASILGFDDNNQHGMATNYTDAFYGIRNNGSTVCKLWKFGNTGVKVGEWNIIGSALGILAQTFGIVMDESYAYLGARSGGAGIEDTIVKWDLGGGTGATFVTETGFKSAQQDLGILVLRNGNVLIGWRNPASSFGGFYRLYDPSGATIWTQDFSGDCTPESVIPWLDDTKVIVTYGYSTIATFSGVRVAVLDTSDGSILGSPFDPDDDTFEFDGPVTVTTQAAV